ncbi:hypothetical protein BDN67DRAFT_894471, partial [Paxillus ammoniavirescens]
MPTATIPSAPTQTERNSIIAWIKEDGQAKSIILRKVNSTVMTLVPDKISITAREVWNILANHFDRTDISLQFAVRKQITTLQMGSADDAEKYVAAHTHANERLARMGAKSSEADTIYALIRGLPRSGMWPIIRKNIETE